jgi:hypothetical protein
MKNFLWLFFLVCISLPSHAQYLSPYAEIGKRIDIFSQAFLGKPYLTDPLGEGFGQDSDPLFRFDGFDCTTFVETVLALARARHAEDFERQIVEIRYANGIPEFTERNHFTDADWIPNNTRKGIFRDITGHVNIEVREAEAQIDKSAWFKRVHKMSPIFGIELARVPYITLQSILSHPEILKQIPSGAIINIVRPNWNLKNEIGTNMNISHQGFFIRKVNGEFYFRHASQQYLKVVEEPLLEYLKRMQSVPSIQGINILEPL